MELDDLIAMIFNQVEGPISVDDLVSVLAEIKGVKDLPAISFDSDQADLTRTLSDSNISLTSPIQNL
jgi:predicted transcriptional regulator